MSLVFFKFCTFGWCRSHLRNMQITSRNMKHYEVVQTDCHTVKIGALIFWFS